MAGWNEWVPGTNMTLSEVLDALKSASIGLDVKDKLYWSFYKIVQEAIKEGNANFDVEMAKGVYNTLKDRLDAGDVRVEDVIGELGAVATFKGSASNASILAKTDMIVGDEWYDITNQQSLRWNGTAWIAVGGSVKLGEGSVYPSNTTFFETGLNKLNVLDRIDGQYVNQANGDFEVNASHIRTRHMSLKGQHTLFFQSKTDDTAQNITGAGIRMVFFADNGSYISGYADNPVINFPETAKTVIISWRKEMELTNNVQIVEGTTKKAYEPYKSYIDADYINLDKINASDLVMVLPPKIYGMANELTTIRYDNIVNKKISEFDFDINGTLGWQYDDNYRTGTANASAGTYPITFNLYKNLTLVGSKKTDLVIKSNTVRSDNLLIIGDSTIDGDDITTPLLAEYSTRGGTLNLIGTRGNGHEGRAGWKLDVYRNYASLEGVNNPFYNPEKNDFDFAHYMTTTAQATPDIVVIDLGVNDIFPPTNDAEASQTLDQITVDYNHIIGSIKAFNPNIKIAISLITPPNAKQEPFTNAYGLGQTQWRYKRNQLLLNDRLIKAYQNKEAQGIFILSLMHELDGSIHIGDAVHPNVAGNEILAKNFYAFLNGVL